MTNPLASLFDESNSTLSDESSVSTTSSVLFFGLMESSCTSSSTSSDSVSFQVNRYPAQLQQPQTPANIHHLHLNSNTKLIAPFYVGEKVDVYFSKHNWKIGTITYFNKDYISVRHEHTDIWGTRRRITNKINMNEKDSKILKLNTYTPYHTYLMCQMVNNLKNEHIANCNECDKLCCTYCAMLVDKNKINYYRCEQCLELKEYDDLRKIFIKSIQYIDKYIVEVITSYAIGDIVPCCNFLDCRNEIVFKNELNVINYIDINGNKLHSYCTMIDPQTTKLDKISSDLIKIYDKYYKFCCFKCNELNSYYYDSDDDDQHAYNPDIVNVMFGNVSDDGSIDETIKCCNYNICLNEINFGDQSDLDDNVDINGNVIYQYFAVPINVKLNGMNKNDQNDMILLYDKYRKICCSKCNKLRIKQIKDHQNAIDDINEAKIVNSIWGNFTDSDNESTLDID